MVAGFSKRIISTHKIKKMKTLIINPPCEKGFDRSGRWPAKVEGGTFIEPLFLAYTAAVLEKEGMPVELIDCRPFYISQEQLLEKFDDDIGLAVLQTSTASIKLDLDTALKIKQKFPKTKICLVGSHVSVLDKEIMEENPQIDFIARREYEHTVRDLANALANNEIFDGIPGITFRKNSEIVRNPDRPYIENLDELPFPARNLLPMDTYFEAIFKSKRTFRLMGSRGCPYQCTFCLWPQTMYGRKVRFRDPKKVVDEIEHLISKHRAQGLYFEDDTFALIPSRTIEFCDEIIKRKIKIPWSCMGRVDTINEAMLGKMKKAGCYMIRLGVESASQNILDRAKKGITVEQIIKAFSMVEKAGIETYASYTLGLPGETKETLKETIEFAVRLNSDYAQFGIAMPYPGTEFYQEAQGKGWLRTKNWSDFEASANSVLEYPDLKTEDIISAHKIAYRRFYLRPGYVVRRARRIKSFAEAYQLIRGARHLIQNTISNERNSNLK